MRLLISACIAILLAACSGAPAVPDTPAFKTKQGKACAEQCEAEFSKCANHCSMIRGPTGGPARQRSNCKGGCVREIQACYAACETQVSSAPKKQ